MLPGRFIVFVVIGSAVIAVFLFHNDIRDYGEVAVLGQWAMPAFIPHNRRVAWPCPNNRGQTTASRLSRKSREKNRGLPLLRPTQDGRCCHVRAHGKWGRFHYRAGLHDPEIHGPQGVSCSRAPVPAPAIGVFAGASARDFPILNGP